MAELEMDFQAPVAQAYELRRADELSQRPWKPETYPDLRYIVAVGKPRLVRPKRWAMDGAIGRLLQIPMPRRATATGDAAKRAKVAPLAQEEVAALELNVLLIAKHVGLLWGYLEDKKSPAEHGPRPDYESISSWFDFARSIQETFKGRDYLANLPICDIGVYLSRQSDGSRSMVMRPIFAHQALSFHAAQMIAGGAVSQTCEHCGTPFLSGVGGGEKRGGARFCSDKCRYSYHNEAKRKRRG
jgi:hypothetical protein